MKKILVSFLAVVIFSVCASAELKTFPIFENGKLMDGVQLVNGEIVNGEILTAELAAEGWAKPRFEVKGFDIDISRYDLAQIKVKIVAVSDKIEQRPNYADVAVLNSKGEALHIQNFPFRAYDSKDPMFMTRALTQTDKYGSMPKGKSYGGITGLSINTGFKAKLRLKEIKVMIETDFESMYPDDPVADPKWKDGKPGDVYAVSVSDRVFQDELDSPLKKGNTVWKKGKVHIAGARMETVAFQVVLECPIGTDGINNVDVKFDSLVKPTGYLPWEWFSGWTIDNSQCRNLKDPYYFPKRHFQLYKSRYLKIDKQDNFTNAEIVKQAGTIGRSIPDILIPFEAKWGGAPFSIFPGQTQSVWVDVIIPNNAPAGKYEGMVEVTHDGIAVKSVPVELEVYDFDLPEDFSITAFMVVGDLSRYGFKGEEYCRLVETYRRFLRRNNCYMYYGTENSKENTKRILFSSSGAYFTNAAGYEGRNYAKDDPLNFITFYNGKRRPFGGPEPDGDEKSWHEGLKKWKDKYDGNCPNSQLVFYAWDEPSHNFPGGLGEFRKWLNAIGPWVKSFNEKYKADVKIYATTWPDEIKGIPYIDACGARNSADAEEMIKAGKQVWLYNGPMTYLNFVSGMRICGWKAFALKANVWWIWESTAYPAGFDMYSNPCNFLNQYGELGEGDGLLLYPGTDTIVTKRSPGLKGPVPCQRFFNWRQGLIDYEYLALASKKNPELARKIADEIVSGASLGCGLPSESKSLGYPRDNTIYDSARKKLAEIIQK
ncbi:MAG TPA: hypothetical protein DET40_12090 [Lentisphaeria bacterium]|nr:MAG: hypothetical protein A2X45_07645 [Lentisphaerae bacterium GWF2_50_93]HCE44280.1 hypothetical protein [Lentisphaeria bacterium]